MSYLFQTIQTQLSTDQRPVKIEPILSYGIDEQGWHKSGVYKIYNDQGQLIGLLNFEGSKWHFTGMGLSDVE